MTETTKRILELQNQRGIRTYTLEKEAGLPISSIRSWINGKKQKDGRITPTSPSTEAIIKLATYFNVSADYLLCLTDEPKLLTEGSIMERPTSTLSIELAKDQRFINSAKLYKAMPNEYQSEVYAYIFGVAVGLGLNVKQILK